MEKNVLNTDLTGKAISKYSLSPFSPMTHRVLNNVGIQTSRATPAT